MPYWLKSSMEMLAGQVQRSGLGVRQLDANGINALATYIMFPLGDIMERAAGLIWRSEARKRLVDAIKEALPEMLISRDGQTVNVATGEAVVLEGVSGSDGETALMEAVTMVGGGESDFLQILQVLHYKGVRLMSTEDLAREAGEDTVSHKRDTEQDAEGDAEAEKPPVQPDLYD